MTTKTTSRYAFSALVITVLSWSLLPSVAQQGTPVSEALTGLDNQTNGAISQAEFDLAKDDFSEVEEPEEGLGPIFNNTSCVGCHLSGGAVGGSSQVTVLRAGRYETTSGRRGRRDQNEQFVSGGAFVPATVRLADGSSIVERSLINQRALCAEAQSILSPQDYVTAQRISLSILGDGYVEAVPNQTFRALAASQASATQNRIHGQVIDVPLLEAEGSTGVGRFGAKNQHASLLSFAADAYLNEMGITSPLLPDEVTTLCQPDGAEQPSSPNTPMEDIENFAVFMRATKVPSRGTITQQAMAGLSIFRTIECSTCHVESLQTAPAGTQLFAGQYTVPAALGNKVFHPFSDFLLHDIGTGDGIVQNGGEDTANKLRTMPLWGLRTRTELMHDGASTTYDHAVLRHRGEALNAARRYYGLTPQQKQALWAFLRSL